MPCSSRQPYSSSRPASRVPKNRVRPLPTILHANELQALFAAFRRPDYRALFMTCYAAGLRINEACHLQVADLDSQRMLIHVRHAKGGTERYTLLSPRLLQVLRDYWRLARPTVWLFPGSAARAALFRSRFPPHTLRFTSSSGAGSTQRPRQSQGH